TLLILIIPVTHVFTQTITTLDLSSAEISSHGAQDLANALLQNKVALHLFLPLLVLALNHYFIQTLTTLDLSYNQIGPQGTQYLTNALLENKVTSHLLHPLLILSIIVYFTQTLDLKINRVGDAGKRYFEEILKMCPEVKVIWY